MTGRVEKGKRQSYLCNTGICAVSIFIIAALIWRIQCSISYYDEVLNIYISYITAALGQRHLVENGYIFSMGDLFNLPFVYLFWRTTGGTEGLVLFIRFVYLGFNLVLAGVFWWIFGKYLGKMTMILFGLILITFFPGGMYTVSYDTMALFFSLMGCILLLGSELRENEKSGLYRYFAGICHACMVYSYPLMAVVVLFLLVGNTVFHICKNHISVKELLRYWLPYCLGGMTVLCVFCVYVLYVGWENIFFLQAGAVKSNLSGREIGELTSVGDAAGETVYSAVSDAKASDVRSGLFLDIVRRVGKQLFELLNYMWIQQKRTIVFTLIMLLQWGIGLIKKGKWRLILILEIFFVAFCTHTQITCFGGTTMYAYYFLWAPFLFFYLDETEKRQGKIIFLILGLVSIASFLAIGFTSVRTDKAHMGLYCGAMCTFLFMIMLTRKEQFVGIVVSMFVVLTVAMSNLGMAYIDHFQGADIAECTYRMQKGVFKGIMTWEKDVQYENLKTCLEQKKFDKDALICMTDYNYYAACLDGDLRATEGNFDLLKQEKLLREGTVPEIVYEGSWPDVILIDKEDIENYDRLVETMTDDYYELALDEREYCLYIRKE